MHTEDRLASFQHSAEQRLSHLPRPPWNQLLDGAADVRFRGDAVVLRECLVDPNETQLAIGEPATDTTPAPTQPPSAPNTTVHHHPGMQMDMSTGMKK